jgi:hypothetical protein
MICDATKAIAGTTDMKGAHLGEAEVRSLVLLPATHIVRSITDKDTKNTPLRQTGTCQGEIGDEFLLSIDKLA